MNDGLRQPVWYLAIPYIRGVSVHAPDRVTNAAPESLDYLILNEGLAASPDISGEFAKLWSKIKPGGVLAFNFPVDGALLPAQMQALVEKQDKGAVVLTSRTPIRAAPGLWGMVLRKLDVAGWAPQIERPAHQQVLIYRPGGYGDGLCAASVAGQFDIDNTDVTLLTLPPAGEAVAHDPRLYKVLVYEPDRVPMPEVAAFLAIQSDGYDRFINLNETYEGAILAIPGRVEWDWPDAIRRARGGSVNAQELACRVADVPYRPVDLQFFGSAEDEATAGEIRDALLAGDPDAPLIVWGLAGSAGQKWWPGTPEAVSAVLAASPRVVIALAGANNTRDTAYARLVIERCFEDHGTKAGGRICWLGQDGVTLREAYALAQLSDIVVSIESGILNAVAQREEVHKVALLVHSTPHNLTRDWRSVTVITSEHEYYPCLRLHLPGADCPAGVCAKGFSVTAVVESVTAQLRQLQEDFGGGDAVRLALPEQRENAGEVV